MKVEKQIFLYNVSGLICAFWFLFAGSIWTYFINLFVAYPVGLLGLFFWYKGRVHRQKNTFNNIVLTLLASGLIISVVTFFLYYFDVW